MSRHGGVLVDRGVGKTAFIYKQGKGGRIPRGHAMLLIAGYEDGETPVVKLCSVREALFEEGRPHVVLWLNHLDYTDLQSGVGISPLLH